MHKFQDAQNDHWEIRITAGTVRRVQEELGFDLGNILDATDGKPAPLARLYTDLVFLVNLLWVLCQKQAVERGIDDLEFADRLEGEAIAAAYRALQEELIHFFQSLGQAHVVAAIRKNGQMIARAVERATATIDGQAFEEATAHQLDTIGPPPGSDASPLPEPVD